MRRAKYDQKAWNLADAKVELAAAQQVGGKRLVRKLSIVLARVSTGGWSSTLVHSIQLTPLPQILLALWHFYASPILLLFLLLLLFL